MKRVPLHVIGGFLGAGKTTSILHLVASRAAFERAAVVVNDVGEAAVDATILGGGASITNIPGGCVCCTAPEGLVDAVRLLLDTQDPDRIYIEPSGLAHPADVVDMLERGPLAARLDRRPLIVLVDPGVEPSDARSEHLLESADVVVLNRTDLAGAPAVRAARARMGERWPPPMLVVETSHGVLPVEVLEWAPGEGPQVDEAEHTHAHDTTEGYLARSWRFMPDRRLRFDTLRAIAADAALVRVKGLFRTELGWFRMDRAGGRVHVAATPWRRDSRMDVIARDTRALDEVERRLAEASTPAPTPGEGVVLEPVLGEGWVLDRVRLGALEGQVPDVGVVVPGRSGGGVWLREVLALATPPAGARFVVVANDGLTTAPAPVSGAGEAVLVFHDGGEAVPASQGGPYRILAPAGPGRTACANVKGVARIRVLPAGE